MRVTSFVALGLAVASACCAGRATRDDAAALEISPEQRQAARDYMDVVVTIAVKDVWSVHGLEPPEDGAADGDAWAELDGKIAALAALGEGIKDAPFAYDDGLWESYAQEVVAATDAMTAAANARDSDAFYEAGDAVAMACEACHVHYGEVAPGPDELD